MQCRLRDSKTLSSGSNPVNPVNPCLEQNKSETEPEGKVDANYNARAVIVI